MLTLVLPLGWFIVVMIAMYFVFTRPHTVPGHQAIAGARPVAPAAGAAAPIAAATGFPTATAPAAPSRWLTAAPRRWWAPGRGDR